MRPSILSLGLWAASLVSVVRCDGNIVHFPVALTWGKGAPDGFERDMIFVNGTMPGPTLNLEEGDDVQFVVENKLPFATTVHFHGIQQYDTPWSDGVPGVSQEKIQPGASFNYTWTATQYGTYWYHGHTSGQIEDGLFGAINIKPAANTPTPWSLISKDSTDTAQLDDAMQNPEMVVLSDWFHFTSEELRNISIAADVDPVCGDSLLINGKGNVNCKGVPFYMSLIAPPALPLLGGQNITDKGCVGLSDLMIQGKFADHKFDEVPTSLWSGCNATEPNPYVFTVDASKGWVSLNMISTASLQEMTVSIDDHPMWVYAIDGRYIEPQKVDAMILQHGSRHSVMVQLNQPAQDYTFRVAGSGLAQKVFVAGTLSYANGAHKNVDNPSINFAGANTSASVVTLNDSTVVPFPPVRPAQDVDQTNILNVNRSGFAWAWYLNGATPYNTSLEDIKPLLFNPTELNNTGLTITTKNNTWVDLIVVVTDTAGLQPPHPIHKHSNKASIIGSGTGPFKWPTVADAMKDIPHAFNLDNPPYRDGFYTARVLGAPVWTAIRYQVTNPGAFFMHCHINPHLTGGMGLTLLDGIDAWPTIPPEYQPGHNGLSS